MATLMHEKQDLRVGHVNIYHLQNKVLDLCAFLNKPSYFHLYGITETRLAPHISDEAVAIPNFSIIRRDPTCLGETGIAVYIHLDIQHIIRRRSDLEIEEVECIWVELKPSSTSPPLLIGILYRNPKSTFQWHDHFLKMMDKICSRNTDILLLGDFNFDLFVPQPAWESTTTLVGLKQFIEDPTRITATSKTLLDHIYTNRPEAIIKATVDDLSISDHQPVNCTWRVKLQKIKKNKHTCITYRSFKRFNESAFFADLSKVPFANVFNSSDPNEALNIWYELFLPTLNKHAPLRRKRVKHPTMPPWLSQEIINAMALRDKLKKEKCFTEYKTMRNKVKSMVRQAKKSLFDRLVIDNKDVSLLWKAMNLITKGKGKRSLDTPPNLTANKFNDHFLSVSNLLAHRCKNTSQYVRSENLINFCKQRTNNTTPFSIPNIAAHEIGMYISKMSNKKSSGLDEISPKILKLSLPYISESLTYIYNISIECNIFPTALKEAKVIPLPKTKDLSQVSNFRPISLLSVISKPLEKHVHKHLLDYLERRNLLHSLQSGFRQKHSCHTALTRLADTWLSTMNECKLTGTVFLDFKKAFDLVDHDTLLTKLHAYLVNHAAISFFRSYLNKRKQKVLLNGSYSSEGHVNCGVPQGSILGPILFSIFINDLPLHVSNPTVCCDLFADDGTIHTQEKSIMTINFRLQESLNEVSEWCTKNAMILNPSKTECMVICTRQKRQLGPLSLNLSMGGSAIKQVSDHRLLGVIIDHNLTWQDHINYICKIISRNMYMLSKLKYLTDMNARQMFYNAHIRSHIDYASTVWDGSSDIHLKRLNSLHRRAMKLIIPDTTLTTDEKLKKLGILPLSSHFMFNKSIMMFKVANKSVPQYLLNLFNPRALSYSSSRQGHFQIAHPRIDMYKCSLSFSGASLWNSLPQNIITTKSLPSFKENLFKYLMSI